MRKIKDYSLYLIITEKYGKGRTISEIAEAAIRGGVDIIQMREKKLARSDSCDIAASLAEICKRRGVLFIVNDDPILAKEAGADGVHLGQEDLRLFTVDEARKIVGPDKILGVSASSIEEAKKADASGADYIGFGPVFPTVVKERCVGTKDVGSVLEATRKPVVFIGGISLKNIDRLLARGARNVAAIRGILEAEDIASTAKKFKEKLKDAKNGKTA